ncbi:MAG: tRNA (adenine(22)-N(1))-methyltransferase [Bacilli bacterium]
MELPVRLKQIASLIKNETNVIDIGCDHGLLDIYLTNYKNCKCIASDINENALSNAKKNILKYKLNDKIETIVSDGFENIEINYLSTAIISGMGTLTILDILKKANLTNIENLIIQANNNLETLRKEISKIGFYIKDEIVVCDRNIYYVIINLEKGNKKYNLIDYILGPKLKLKKDKITINYYINLIKKNNDIIKKIPINYIFKKLYLKWINRIIKKTINYK